MGVQALISALEGRLRPSFFCLLCAWSLAFAEQAVYRCGQEYTNAPVHAARCERVASQAVTVIPGTRVQGSAALATVTLLPASSASRSGMEGMPQRQRDDMARSILDSELERARQRHARLQEEYRQGEPARLPDEIHNPQKYQGRVSDLRAALERSQRDIDSLQRELTRRPSVVSTP